MHESHPTTPTQVRYLEARLAEVEASNQTLNQALQATVSALKAWQHLTLGRHLPGWYEVDIQTTGLHGAQASQRTTSQPSATSAADTLNTLWNDDTHDWKLTYQPSESIPWRVDAQWHTDQHTQWTTLTWTSYGDTPEAALTTMLLILQNDPTLRDQP